MLAVVLGWEAIKPAETLGPVVPPVTVVSSATPAASPRAGAAPSVVDLRAQVTTNKLYSAGKVPAVRCRPPTAALRTKAALLTHARVLVDCMHRAWSPLVAQGDFYLEVPKLAAYKDVGEKSTTCGAPPPDSEAFYCPSDAAIFFEWELYLEEDPEDPEWDLVYFQFMLAHEYAHHLQSMIGILAAYDANHESASAAVKLEDERRLELQADCLGAAFLGANHRALQLTDEWREIFEYQVRDTGDDTAPELPRDHGSRKSHAYWSLRAFASGNPASCNTFVAPAARVS
ncbi:neutral zinc metallopeptidase [Kribbella sp. CA-247076]|uniref:neutral zinc metallopeptidase n=1 Tax=Kribbella sp. CA-247076 TaxID=3239941 RepID=UPI003D8DC84E